MFKLVADENFNRDIVRGLLRRNPGLDLVRVQDVGIAGKDDPTVLAWAAGDGRLVLTHDKATMAGYAFDRVRGADPMPGVIVISASVLVGDAIEDILLVVECSEPAEWEGQVRFLPLR